MKKRYLFSGSSDFCLYDLVGSDSLINENVFAYSNRSGGEMALVVYNNAYSRSTGWIKGGAVAIPQKDGTFRQDSLCQALSLHGEDRYFTVFHEQRSGLWYVRSSKDLAERGLFVGLNGYETQVFLDIKENEDAPEAVPGSWDGRWARLNFELNGRGVRDLEAALLDIYLGDLYEPFSRIFKKERVDQLCRFFETAVPNGTANAALSKKEIEEEERNNKAKKAEFMDYFREPVLTFAETALKHLAGISGGYEVFTIEETEAGTLRQASISDEVWKEFSSYLEHLLQLAETPEGRDLVSGQNVLGQNASGQNAPLILGYGALSMLRIVLGKGVPGSEAARLAEHWQLTRKVRECWEKMGIPAADAYKTSELARLVLSRTSPVNTELYSQAAAKEKSGSALAAAIILENYDADDFRKALGVNRFEDVTWFNKEAFEDTLLHSCLFLIPESAAAFGKSEDDSSEGRKKRIAVINAMIESLCQAEKSSGYRLDELLAALSGGEPSSCGFGGSSGGEQQKLVKKQKK